MRWTSLLVFVFASVVLGGAWWTQARAAAVPRTEAGGAAPAAAPPIPSPTRKLDEYGNISWGDERARLDNYAIELQNDPRVQGYIICYGGRRGRVGEAERRCRRAVSYVDHQRRIDAARTVTVDGGFREELTVELWVVPPGVTPPQPSPTVDPSDVKIIKTKPRRSRPKR